MIRVCETGFVCIKINVKFMLGIKNFNFFLFKVIINRKFLNFDTLRERLRKRGSGFVRFFYGIFFCFVNRAYLLVVRVSVVLF